MFKNNLWAVLLLLATVPFGIAACGGDTSGDRTALEEDELDRELDLALQGDTVPATFEDTVIEPPALDPEPRPAVPTPPPTERPAAEPRPEPPPARAEPQPEPPPERESTPAPAPEPRTVTSTAGVGTTMSLTLDQNLSTRDNTPGDGFTATIQEPVLDASGTVVIPVGATVRGRVTQVQKSGRVGEAAVINLAFESVSFGGASYPLEASVVKANPERDSRESTGEQVGKVAAGAAAGAILGRVLGKNTKSTIGGAVIGAAAGTAIAMGTSDVDAVLKAGSTMVIRLDSPVSVSRTVS